MAPTKAAAKRHPEGRKTTHSTTSKSDCMALFRDKVQGLLPAPRSATGPGDAEFLSRICRTTSDGYVHIIQMERYGPTEAGEDEILAVIDMEGHQSLFEPLTASSTTSGRRSVRASTKSRTQASSARAAMGNSDDADYQPSTARGRQAKSTATAGATKPARTTRARKTAASASGGASTTSRRSRRAEKDLDELCGLVDDLDVVSNLGGPAASACGSESTRVSGNQPQASTSRAA